jgi:O-antigen ligase
VIFGLFRYLVTKEIIITSSGTIRTLTSNPMTVLFFAICYLLFYKRRLPSPLFLPMITFFILSIGIILSGHRSAFFVFFCLVIIYSISDSLFKLDFIWIPLFSIACMILLILAIQTGSLTSINATIFSDTIKRAADTINLDNNTTQGRLLRWQNAFNIVSEHPLLGLGRFPVYTSHMDAENSRHMGSFSELDRSEHNAFISKLVHEGILGLAITITFFYFLFKDTGKSLAKHSKFSFFLRIYLASFIIYSMFNTTFSNPMGRIFFFIAIGLLYSEILYGHPSIKKTKFYNTSGRETFKKVFIKGGAN